MYVGEGGVVYVGEGGAVYVGPCGVVYVLVGRGGTEVYVLPSLMILV